MATNLKRHDPVNLAATAEKRTKKRSVRISLLGPYQGPVTPADSPHKSMRKTLGAAGVAPPEKIAEARRRLAEAKKADNSSLD